MQSTTTDKIDQFIDKTINSRQTARPMFQRYEQYAE